MNKWKLLVACLFGLSLPFTGWAQIETEQAKGFAGLSVGMADPSDLDSRVGYGAEIGLKFIRGWSLSGYFLSSAADEGGVDTAISHYGLAADYYLDQWVEGLHAGARLGASTTELSGAGIDDTDTNLSLGPRIGYQYQLNEVFSLGGDLTWMNTFAEENDYSTLYALLSGRYWF